VALAVRGTLEPELLLLVPVVALLFCFVLGLSLVVSVLHAHYRDVEPVLGAALLPWFFITPIFLRVEDLPGVADRQWLANLLQWANPIAPFVDAVRQVLYAGTAPGPGHLIYIALAGILALGGGILLFRRMARDLAVVL